MRRTLLAVALLGVAAIVFSLAARDAYNFNPALWGLSFIAGGAGIGTIAGRPIYGAAWGLLLARIIHRLLVARRVSEGGETNYPRLRVGLPKRIVRSKPRTDE